MTFFYTLFYVLNESFFALRQARRRGRGVRELGFLRIVAPVLQAPVGFAGGVLLRRRLLRQMAFTVRDDATHVRYILLFIIPLWIPSRILRQDLDDLSPRFMPNTLSAAIIFGPAGGGGIVGLEPGLEIAG